MPHVGIVTGHLVPKVRVNSGSASASMAHVRTLGNCIPTFCSSAMRVGWLQAIKVERTLQ